MIEFRERNINIRINFNPPQVGPGGLLTISQAYAIRVFPRVYSILYLSSTSFYFEEDAYNYNVMYLVQITAIVGIIESDPVELSFRYG